MGAVGVMDKLLLYGLLKNKSGAEISASGNPVTLSGTLADNPLKECKIYGWSKQFTTTGKNLINADEYYSQFKQSDGTYKLKTVILNDIRISLSEFVGKEITLSVKLTVGANTSAVFLMYISSEQKKINGSTIKSGLTGKSILTVTPVSNTDYFVISFGSGNDDVTFSELQLELGSVATSYEPYTGGQPSPSPEYPQEIESAGSDGKIGMEVRGKNLMDFTKAPDVSDLYQGWKIPKKDYESATVTLFDNDVTVDISEIYFGFTGKGTNTSGGYIWMVRDGRIEKRELNSKSGYLSVFPKDAMKTFLQRFKILVEIGTIPTAYEPYHEPQSLSIQTPTGLPAIPVGTGGNYTDTNGQQWIADYIDLKRGKHVQMVQTAKVPNDANWSIQKQPRGYSLGYATLYKNGISTQKPGMKNTWKSNMGDSSNMWSNGFSFGRSTVFWIAPYENDGNITSDDINAWLVEHPMDIMYPLATPIEHDLTQDEIQAYQNLVTYAGTTIVENAAECYMEVSAGGGDALRAKKLALLLED